MPRLDQYDLLGRSGLRVSPMALGGMTMGTAWGWGADRSETRRIVDLYADGGGNFIDGANEYTGGESEEYLGEVLDGRRDRFVLATKFGLSQNEGDPNGGGAHRKAIRNAIDHSLRRLKTDYIDLYYLHIWDWRTPIEETVMAMNDLVREGKVLYLGISDTPAWKVAEANMFARQNGLSPFVAYQGRYSLVDRTMERDILPMSMDHGLRPVTWQALASGVLTGKYLDGKQGDVGGRSGMTEGMGLLTERNAEIAKEVVRIAMEMNVPPAAVAVAWVMGRSGAPVPIIGARTEEQLRQNLAAADVELSMDHRERLAKVSAFDLGFPLNFAAMPSVAGLTDKGVAVAGGPEADIARWS
ncbi:MAG: aldo/keto reductase [Pseudomonadota bacterium]